MSESKPHLKALGEIEETGVPGLVEVLREEGIDAVRDVLWDATGYVPRLFSIRLAYPGQRGAKAH